LWCDQTRKRYNYSARASGGPACKKVNKQVVKTVLKQFRTKSGCDFTRGPEGATRIRYLFSRWHTLLPEATLI